MATNRTPISRSPIARITSRAAGLFERMQDVSGDDWWTLHGELHRELGLEPWEWPAIAAPDELSGYPAGSAGSEWFPHAQKLYRDLEAKIS